MNIDTQYFELAHRILRDGTLKHTRAGDTISVFGATMRWDLRNGLPLLTTKKVFTRGAIHELLWFLKGDTNIKYLVDNYVHIWDDDAYRWYKTIVDRHNENDTNPNNFVTTLSKEEFLTHVIDGASMTLAYGKEKYASGFEFPLYDTYKFGDLGTIYGKSWRKFGSKGIDQIKNIIHILKNNPDDRRMLCVAYNPDELETAALPPCHIMFQFYSRELGALERLDWLCEHSNSHKYDEWKTASHEVLDKLNVPRRALSCAFTMRSNDLPLGNPLNLVSYAILTHMIAQCTNMAVDELIYNGGDVHVYTNQIEALEEQLTRDANKYNAPKLWLNPNIKDIDSFTFDDIKIENYESYPAIKFPLSVGV